MKKIFHLQVNEGKEVIITNASCPLTIVNNNGFDYVDLDLPSGTLWATKNIGASKLSDFGLYFQFGDIKGYTAEQIGKDKGQKAFTWKDYKFSIDGSGYGFSKYTTKGATLELEDDAAHINMGGNWHMPSPEQILELINNTINKRIKLDNVSGIKFTSKKDESKSIFIPASGYASKGVVYDIRAFGHIWSSMLSDYIRCGQYLFLPSAENIRLNSYSPRYYGYSVRGVIG